MFSAKELQAREQKLRLEQSQRIDRERQKIEKERILQDRQKQREREREEERARKKLEQELAEQKVNSESLYHDWILNQKALDSCGYPVGHGAGGSVSTS